MTTRPDKIAQLREQAATLEPAEAQLQILAAAIPEARAMKRIDREPSQPALTIHVLGKDDD